MSSGLLQCITYPTQVLVATYRFGGPFSPGTMTIYPSGQHMEPLLLATGWLTDRIILQSRYLFWVV